MASLADVLWTKVASAQLLPVPPSLGQVCLSDEEVAELQSLSMPDQAAVIAARLARTGGDALQGRLLQELVVAQVGAGEYSITHGLLAGMRLQAVVTTNYDTLFEAACAGARRHSPSPALRLSHALA